MHLAISWDIGGSGEPWTRANDRLQSVLAGYSWVRPLSTFYIVTVNGEWDRTSIIGGLQAVAESSGNRVNFVVSPLMANGARYQGWLPKDMWDNINERTG